MVRRDCFCWSIQIQRLLKLNQAVNGETINPRKIQIQRLLKLNRIIKLLWKLTAHYSNTTIVKVKWILYNRKWTGKGIQIQRLLKLNTSHTCACCIFTHDSNTTIVKVKLMICVIINLNIQNSNTTIVKVK